MNVRLIPVSSKAAVLCFVDAVKNYPDTQARNEFVAMFEGAIEDWYFQEVDGRSYIIAVTQGDRVSIDSAFAKYKDLDQPFFNWFRDQILLLTGIDMREQPGGERSELLFEFAE